MSVYLLCSSCRFILEYPDSWQRYALCEVPFYFIVISLQTNLLPPRQITDTRKTENTNYNERMAPVSVAGDRSTRAAQRKLLVHIIKPANQHQMSCNNYLSSRCARCFTCATCANQDCTTARCEKKSSFAMTAIFVRHCTVWLNTFKWWRLITKIKLLTTFHENVKRLNKAQTQAQEFTGKQ